MLNLYLYQKIPDQLVNISDPSVATNRIQVFSTIFLGATALIVPYFSEFLKHQYNKPRLRMKFRQKPPDCHLTQMGAGSNGIPVYYFRLTVENLGKTQAEECEVFLEKIYKKNSLGKMVRIKNFTPINLKWSGIREQFKRDIQPNKAMFCDIGRIQHPKNPYISQYRNISTSQQNENKFAFELPEIYFGQWDCVLAGEYSFYISVYSKNAEKVSESFKLMWTGKWKNKDVNMFKEIKIKTFK